MQRCGRRGFGGRTGDPRLIRSVRRAGAAATALLCAVALAGCAAGGLPTSQAAGPSTPATHHGSHAPAPPPPTPSPTPTESAILAPGTPLATGSNAIGSRNWFSSDGSVVAYLNQQPNQDFAKTQIDLYDLRTGQHLGTIDPDAANPECGFRVVSVPGAEDVLITLKNSHTPAQGIYPATYTQQVIATDARTLAQLWTLPVAKGHSDADTSCNTLDKDDESSTAFTTLLPTTDGKYGVLQAQKHASVVDLRTGAARTLPRRSQFEPWTLGRWVGLPVDYPGSNAPKEIEIVDPATLQVKGALTGQTMVDNLAGGDVASQGPDASLVDGSAAVVGDMLVYGAHEFSLPSGSVRSTNRVLSTSAELTPVAGSSLVLVTDADQSGVWALDTGTGGRLWRVPNAELCGTTGRRVWVTANDSLGVLDVHTGEQVDFRNGIGCPHVASHVALFGDGETATLLPE